MASIFSFRCTNCGEIHEGAPSIGFGAADPYLEHPDAIQQSGELGSDLCCYEDEDGLHYFIRVCLEVPIHGFSNPFLWAVRVSLSKQNFERYVQSFADPDENDCYFGWFCNYLPFYEKIYALKTQVRPRANGERPYIVLERTEHPLSVDFHEGINVARAQEIAEAVIHR